ncbi:MAG TPA: hypothetical protein VE913_06100 [Longimicrobium sp.]|nr:hypothetical protein [Longimicrobium sp.]
MSAGERCFRALLRAYPRPFRRRFGAEMEQLFRDRGRQVGHMRVWAEVLGDTLAAAPCERMATLRPLGAVGGVLLLVALHGVVAGAARPDIGAGSWIVTGLAAAGWLAARGRGPA